MRNVVKRTDTCPNLAKSSVTDLIINQPSLTILKIFKGYWSLIVEIFEDLHDQLDDLIKLIMVVNSKVIQGDKTYLYYKREFSNRFTSLSIWINVTSRKLVIYNSLVSEALLSMLVKFSEILAYDIWPCHFKNVKQ